MIYKLKNLRYNETTFKKGGIDMVIVDHEIADRVERDKLIDSFDASCLTNVGYDLRAKKFYVSDKAEERVVLQPNESAFVESVEVVSMPTDMIGRIALKNSRIRLGLSLDAPVYQPGHKTRIYFRLTNVSGDSIELDVGEKYATIMFDKLSAVPDKPYTGAFSDEFQYKGLGDYKNVYKKQIREIEKKTEDLKTVEHSIYGNVLVILTVYIALFSFLTTNISLEANSATLDQYFIFNALLLGCISFLVALMGTIVKPSKKTWTYWIPAVLCFAVAFGLFLLK